jgi:cysteinyl-tRNA synthetase
VEYIKLPDIKPAIDEIELSFCDDLNTPGAVTSLFLFIQIIEQFIESTDLLDTLQQSRFQQVYHVVSFYLNSLRHLDDHLFAFIFSKSYSTVSNMQNADCFCGNEVDNLSENLKLLKVVVLSEERYQLKKDKKFNDADNVRKSIQEYGYQIKDTKDGYEIILS